MTSDESEPRGDAAGRAGIENLTLWQRVHEHLRQEILDNRLPPGSELSEVALSQALGVSRGPLREAIGRLASEGRAARCAARPSSTRRSCARCARATSTRPRGSWASTSAFRSAAWSPQPTRRSSSAMPAETRPLQFGVNLNNREPLIAPDYDLKMLLELSTAVEELGFDSVWVGDSLF